MSDKRAAILKHIDGLSNKQIEALYIVLGLDQKCIQNKPILKTEFVRLIDDNENSEITMKKFKQTLKTSGIDVAVEDMLLQFESDEESNYYVVSPAHLDIIDNVFQDWIYRHVTLG